MRSLALSLIALLPLAGLGQQPNRATLTLVDEDNFNKVAIDLDVTGIGASDDSSTLTGTIEIEVNIDPATGTTDEMTILSADVVGSKVTLSAGTLVANYSATTSDKPGEKLGFSAETINPPGTVNPLNGEFDAAEHQIILDRGKLEVTAVVLFAPQEITYDFGTDNFEGAGSGKGTISLIPGRVDGRKLYFDVSLEFPAKIEQMIETEDLPITADVVFEGTLKAIGETFIELPDYASWATATGLPPSSELDFGPSQLIQNYFLFALGLDSETLPSRLFTADSNGITLAHGSGLALGDLAIEWSDDMITWERVPQNAMTSGKSVLSLGDPLTEPITIGLDGARKYLRLSEVAAP